MYKFLITYQISTSNATGFGNTVATSTHELLSEAQLTSLENQIRESRKKDNIDIVGFVFLNIIKLANDI